MRDAPDGELTHSVLKPADASPFLGIPYFRPWKYSKEYRVMPLLVGFWIFQCFVSIGTFFTRKAERSPAVLKQAVRHGTACIAVRVLRCNPGLVGRLQLCFRVSFMVVDKPYCGWLRAPFRSFQKPPLCRFPRCQRRVWLQGAAPGQSPERQVLTGKILEEFHGDEDRKADSVWESLFSIGQNLHHPGTAGFSCWFHLPGLHFGHLFDPHPHAQGQESPSQPANQMTRISKSTLPGH